MTSDSIFTIYRYEIKVKALNEPIYLLPYGDIHRYAPLCDVEKWLEFTAWARLKKNAYFLGTGDYDDLASTSERKALLHAGLHESTIKSLDDLYKHRTKQLIKEIEFMRGRIIGLVEGNHHAILESGITTTQMMCEELKCKYLGVSSFIRLSFVYGNKRASVDIWVHHGRGASRLAGGSLNTVEQMSNIGLAQIYLMGHDHRKSIATKTLLTLSEGNGELKLSQRKILLGRTGSFLKGYVDGEPSYVAKGNMTPTDLGTLKIELTPKRVRKDGVDSFYIDIHGGV